MAVVQPPVDRRLPVRLPRECHPFLEAIESRFPRLRPAQQRGLTLWVYGVLLAENGSLSAVLRKLRPVFGVGTGHALRQGLREWYRAGADKAAPCRSEVDVATCFAPLLGWVLAWWHGAALALALDATYLGDRLVVLSVSVLYRGTAIPVAWHVAAANRRGPWLEPGLALLRALAPAVPPGMDVLVLADRGLWSPRLWAQITALGWHPLLRLRPDATFHPTGGRRVRATTLLPGPGAWWVGAGVAFKHRPARRPGTLIVVWDRDQPEPWICLTDLPPDRVGPAWYGLRTWVELGFRALKSFGWHWERSRRTDPDRVARHWLVLAVATLLTVAVGTRAEDAELAGREPSGVRVALPPPPPAYRRTDSIFALGLTWLHWLLLRQRRVWRLLWLCPEPWPDPPPDLLAIRGPPPHLMDTYPCQPSGMGEGPTRDEFPGSDGRFWQPNSSAVSPSPIAI
jgi:hypothetical protein